MTGFYDLVRPLLMRLPPEAAHRLTLRALSFAPRRHAVPGDAASLATRVWGIDFPNPVGLAAGFDKNAEVFDPLLRLGFGFVEIGSVTPRPQPGNPRPRLFRLPESAAVINRLGFNSAGAAAAAARLSRRPPRGHPTRGTVGVNLGKNRDSADAAADYVEGVRALGPHADYLVINVSSPNTPGLRSLQLRSVLAPLLDAVESARRALGKDQGRSPPLLVKIAPDLSDEERADIARLALDHGIDGLIVSNTTVSRPPGLASPHAGEAGGLSGRPLFALSTAVLSDMYRLTQGRLPLVGVGGVASGADAYAKIRAGASLVQLYTALVYEGPGLVARVKRDLAAALAADGLARVADAVGAAHRPVR